VYFYVLTAFGSPPLPAPVLPACRSATCLLRFATLPPLRSPTVTPSPWITAHTAFTTALPVCTVTGMQFAVYIPLPTPLRTTRFCARSTWTTRPSPWLPVTAAPACGFAPYYTRLHAHTCLPTFTPRRAFCLLVPPHTCAFAPAAFVLPTTVGYTAVPMHTARSSFYRGYSFPFVSLGFSSLPGSPLCYYNLDPSTGLIAWIRFVDCCLIILPPSTAPAFYLPPAVCYRGSTVCVQFVAVRPPQFYCLRSVDSTHLLHCCRLHHCTTYPTSVYLRCVDSAILHSFGFRITRSAVTAFRLRGLLYCLITHTALPPVLPHGCVVLLDAVWIYLWISLRLPL